MPKAKSKKGAVPKPAVLDIRTAVTTRRQRHPVNQPPLSDEHPNQQVQQTVAMGLGEPTQSPSVPQPPPLNLDQQNQSAQPALLTQPAPFNLDQQNRLLHEQSRRQLLNGTSSNTNFYFSNESSNLATNCTTLTRPFEPNFLVPFTTECVHFHVATSIKNKIFNNEFVEMSSLLPESQTNQNTQLLVLQNGNIVTKEKQANIITNVEKWSDAFIIFISIYILKHPEATQDLLKYMSVIRKLAERNANWGFYDSQFRLRKAVNPASSWSIVDTELWLLSSSSTAPLYSDARPCYDYNFKGLCQKQQCNYKHKCLKCSQNHPVRKCRFSDNSYNHANANTSNFRPNRPNRMPVPSKAQQSTPRPMGPRFNTYQY